VPSGIGDAGYVNRACHRGCGGRSYSSVFEHGNLCRTGDAMNTVASFIDSFDGWAPCNTERMSHFGGVWTEYAASNYLQIDLGHDCGGCLKPVWGVVTQGRGHSCCPE
jgi:hypothetical protein